MQITRDLQVLPLEELESREFLLKVNGNPVSLEIVDREQDHLEMIGRELNAVIGRILQATPEGSPEEQLNRRASRRISSSQNPFLAQRAASERPATTERTDIPSRPGRVRELSMQVIEERKTSPSSSAAPLSSVRKAENFSERMAKFQTSPSQVRTPERSESRRPTFNRSASAKPSSGEVKTLTQIAETASLTAAQTSSLAASSPPSFSLPVSTARSVVEESSDVRSIISQFNPRRQLALSESEKSSEPLTTVPRRRLKNPFERREKRKEKERDSLEGIGKDELANRRNRYTRSTPKLNRLDGHRIGLSRRNSSIFREHRRKKPKMSTTGTVEDSIETASGTYEESDDFSSSEGSSASSPSEPDGPRLCLPLLTSISHYREIFTRMLVDGVEPEAKVLEDAGRQYRSTVSILERTIHTKQHLAGKGFDNLGEESSIEDRMRNYTWHGEDTVELIEQRLRTNSKTMLQVYQSGRFESLVPERIFDCVPSAVGYSIALAERSRALFSPLLFSTDDSAVNIDSERDFDVLLDWAEYELSLPTWTGLTAHFEDKSKIEFGLGFTLGLEISDELLEGNQEKASSFLVLQFKKIVLDAIYSGYNTVILAFPPQYNLVDAAQQAVTTAMEEVEVLLPPELAIYIPSYTR